ADAHGGQPEAALAALELVQERCREAGAATPERMAERDGAAVDVELLLRDLEGTGTGEHLASERLVDLRQVHLLHREAGPPERLLARRHGPPAMISGSTPATAVARTVASGCK